MLHLIIRIAVIADYVLRPIMYAALATAAGAYTAKTLGLLDERGE